MKRTVLLLLILILLMSLTLPALAEDEPVGTDASVSDDLIVITLDPGHGGRGGGSYTWGGTTLYETEIVLKIAQYLKAELESYDGVKVYLTRETNSEEEYERIFEISSRCDIAEKNGSDLFVSLHINGDDAHRHSGACVLVPNGNYRPEVAQEDYKLGRCILTKLRDIGLDIYGGGLITRDSESNPKETYPDGSVSDYYGISRGGIIRNMTSVLIEHCFIDNYYDASNFLSNDTQLMKLAHADCLGIAEYLGLEKPYEASILLSDIEDCWAKDQIIRAVGEGWVKGYIDSSFRPGNSVTRGQFVTFMGRAAGIPDVCDTQMFPDVSTDSYCAAYVQWAAANSIVDGYEDGLFRPDRLITREQMAKIMTRYLALLGHGNSGVYDINDYRIPDMASISPWATEYVAFCYANGLLQGTGAGLFEPHRNATRAEACVVLARMIDFDRSSVSCITM